MQNELLCRRRVSGEQAPPKCGQAEEQPVGTHSDLTGVGWALNRYDIERPFNRNRCNRKEAALVKAGAVIMATPG